MAPSSPVLTVLIAAVLGAGVLAGCGDTSSPNAAETDTVESTSETTGTDEFGDSDVEAARTTLEGVINRDINDPEYHVSGFRSDPALSADLIAQIEGLQEEALEQGQTGLGFDPFVCAQQIPTGVSFNETGSVADRVTLVGVFEFGSAQEEKVTYVLESEGDGSWLLTATECLDAAQARGE